MYKLFAYFKFHSDLGRVIGKIKQNELDCRDTAPLNSQIFRRISLELIFRKSHLSLERERKVLRRLLTSSVNEVEL